MALRGKKFEKKQLHESGILNRHSYLINVCLKDPSAYISDAGEHFIKIQSRTANAFAEFSIEENIAPDNKIKIKWRSEIKGHGNKYQTWSFSQDTPDTIIVQKIETDMEIILSDLSRYK